MLCLVFYDGEIFLLYFWLLLQHTAVQVFRTHDDRGEGRLHVVNHGIREILAQEANTFLLVDIVYLVDNTQDDDDGNKDRDEEQHPVMTEDVDTSVGDGHLEAYAVVQSYRQNVGFHFLQEGENIAVDIFAFHHLSCFHVHLVDGSAERQLLCFEDRVCNICQDIGVGILMRFFVDGIIKG